jgi:hypothetical protein
VPGEPAVLPAEAARRGADADLLVIGTPETNALLRRWADRLPLSLAATGPQPQMPSHADLVLSTLAGRQGHAELDRARTALAGVRRLAAVMGFESPVTPGRSAVVVTATSEAELPALTDLQAFAQSRYRSGDLLVVAGGKRSMFRIGPSYGLGRLDAFTAVRWFFANHALLLLACVAAGSTMLAVRVRTGLERRGRDRLAEDERWRP